MLGPKTKKSAILASFSGGARGKTFMYESFSFPYQRYPGKKVSQESLFCPCRRLLRKKEGRPKLLRTTSLVT